jgi:hypothetical protein
VTLVAIVVAAVLDNIMTAYSQASSESLAFDSGAGWPSSQAQGTSHKAGMVDDLGINTTKHHSHQHLKDAIFRCLCCSGVFLIAVSIGTLFFYFYPGEDKTLGQAFYLSCVTLTTVGFGAIHPQTQGGCLFATFWMLIGVSCTANMICTLGDSLLKHRRDLTSTLMKEECLKEMDADGSGKVDKMEFLRFELVRRGVCKKHDIDNVLAIFGALDTDHSGELDFEDLKKFVL